MWLNLEQAVSKTLDAMHKVDETNATLYMHVYTLWYSVKAFDSEPCKFLERMHAAACMWLESLYVDFQQTQHVVSLHAERMHDVIPRCIKYCIMGAYSNPYIGTFVCHLKDVFARVHTCLSQPAKPIKCKSRKVSK